MSDHASSWSRNHKTRNVGTKCVLNSLANYADRHGCVLIDQQTLATETDQSRSSVQRRLNNLEEDGAIRRIPLRTAGRMGENFIILPPSKLFRAELADIEPFLPRGYVIDPKWLQNHRGSTVGGDESGTSQNSADPTVLQRWAAHRALSVKHGDDPHRASLLGTNIEEKEQKERGLSLSTVESTTAAREADLDASPKETVGLPKRRGVTDTETTDPDTDADFEALATLWPVKDKFAEARLEWKTMTSDDRGGAVAYGSAFLASAKAAGRTKFESLVTYLRGRAWRHRTPTVRATIITAASRAWWAVFWRKIERGESVGFMLSEAERGQGWPVKPNDLPSDQDEQRLVVIATASDAFKAWQGWVSSRGFRLPWPTHVEVIFVPSEYPPGMDPVERAEVIDG